MIIIITVWMLVPAASCHRSGEGTRAGGNAANGPEEKEGGITLTREQFKESAMVIGEPVPSIFQQEVEATGYLVSSLSGRAEVSPLISGRVGRIYHSEGEHVEKGTLLFTLEGQEIIAIQQEYALAFHQLRVQEATYYRLKSLTEEKVAATKDFQKAESDYQSTKAQVEGLRLRLALLLIDPVITAPETYEFSRQMAASRVRCPRGSPPASR